MTKTMQGLLIGLASALIGVLLTPAAAARPSATGHANVVSCNR